MADIFKEITLTERNNAGPYFDVFYSTDCINYTQSVDGDNVYLPFVGATAIVTVPEETICIQLTSEGVCTNSVISGSTTTTTTTSPTTTTTTTTTAGSTKLLMVSSSNNTTSNFNQSANNTLLTFVTSGTSLRLQSMPIGENNTSSLETLTGIQTVNSSFNVSGVSYGSLSYTSSFLGDNVVLDSVSNIISEPATSITIGHGLQNTDAYTTMSIELELNPSPTTTTTTTTTFACSEWELFCPSNASGDCRFEVDCCDGSTITYEMPPDSNVFACVIAGGTVTKLSTSGIASDQGTSCSTNCGDVSTTTTTTTTSTTTSTTTTTTINPADCVEYEIECRSGAVGGWCAFYWKDCNNEDDTVILPADTNEFICAISGSVGKTTTSGHIYTVYDPCYTAITLEYGSVDCSTVCSNFGSNPSGTFYMNDSNFLLATKLYTDLGFTEAPANFYTDGTNCRPVDGSGNLGTASSC
jgi:hypothetical protein